eukprot:c2236_g1_i1.p1 GENE.c2236_g1_i1~~c2236_g1_i1.p1  ORF type:complete len:144 (-),score=31.77 c2236_g1_i1:65-433(-)
MATKGPITTHILDTSQGRPAKGVPVTLLISAPAGAGGAKFTEIGRGVTDADGRIMTLLSPTHTLVPGEYQISFALKEYFEAQGVTEYFYPHATIDFIVKNVNQHYHVPLLLNPFGFSTYRGS